MNETEHFINNASVSFLHRQINEYCIVLYLDIDECAENGRICLNGQCVNEPGSYKCRCSPGFQLSPDGAFCLGKLVLRWLWLLFYWLLLV